MARTRDLFSTVGIVNKEQRPGLDFEMEWRNHLNEEVEEVSAQTEISPGTKNVTEMQPVESILGG